MIFVTVGTESFQFDRLIRAIDQAIINKEIEDDVFAQIGSSQYKPKSFSYQKIISFDEMVKAIKKADIIVSHAGIGTTLLCISLGKIPILFPRKHSLKEHLDDHQLEFAKKMEKSNKVLIACDDQQLIYQIKNYKEIINQIPHNDMEQNDQVVNYLNKICS